MAEPFTCEYVPSNKFANKSRFKRTNGKPQKNLLLDSIILRLTCLFNKSEPNGCDVSSIPFQQDTKSQTEEVKDNLNAETSF